MALQEAHKDATFQCFEEIQKETSGCLLRTTTSISKNIIVVLVASQKAHKDATFQCFEEIQKEPRVPFMHDGINTKNIIVVLVASTKAHRDATEPQFEEV